MKQRIPERMRSTVEAFRRRQGADTTPTVLPVNLEVDGYGGQRGPAAV